MRCSLLSRVIPFWKLLICFTVIYFVKFSAPFRTTHSPHCKKNPVDFTVKTGNWLPVHVPLLLLAPVDYWLIITKTSLFKYIGKFTSKIWKISDKNSNIFLMSAQKHRLWVLVRTALPRRFLRVPTIYILSRNMKNNVYPCTPQFYYIKVGFKAVIII